MIKFSVITQIYIKKPPEAYPGGLNY
jgi:hypothetical protein